MTIHIDIWADFICPYCYLTTCYLAHLKDDYALEVRWHAWELRPPRTVPHTPEDRQNLTARYEADVYPRLREACGHAPTPIALDLDSRPALILEQYAHEQGDSWAFHTAVAHAYWRDGQDISDTAVLQAIGASLGWAADAVTAALHNSGYEQAVLGDIEDAREIHAIRGIPLMIFSGVYRMSGAKNEDQLREMLDRIVAEQG
jgi:predicted DsbA family dithiol-disulfide isomerase